MLPTQRRPSPDRKSGFHRSFPPVLHRLHRNPTLTDRSALVTRHRRAPAGPAQRRRSGGRFLRPAGSPRWPGFRHRGARSSALLRLPSRALGSATEMHRLPQVPHDGARRRVGGSGRHAQNLPAPCGRRIKAPANTTFLETLASASMLHTQSPRLPGSPLPSCPTARCGDGGWGVPAASSAKHRKPRARAAGRASPRRPSPAKRATWLILPVAYACLKD